MILIIGQTSHLAAFMAFNFFHASFDYGLLRKIAFINKNFIWREIVHILFGVLMLTFITEKSFINAMPLGGEEFECLVALFAQCIAKL